MILWEIIRPGDLVFDIGANVGLVTKLFKEFGAKVIAVEPDPEVSLSIQADVLIPKACTDKNDSKVRLYLPNRDSMGSLSTLATTIETNAQNQFWKQVFTDNRYLDVETISLDAMIQKYGVPRYIKIDVEGGEETALKGLNKGIDYLSFETHLWDIDNGVRCCQKILSLGNYEFTVGWRDEWTPSAAWGNRETITNFIKKYSKNQDWWNIFCRRQQ